jgi:hypothetical protein
MAIAGIKKDKVDAVWELVYEMAEVMSSGSDTDGLGYTAMDSEGNLFGERWLKNKEAFKTRQVASPVTLDDVVGIEQKYKGMLKRGKEPVVKNVKYNTFGDHNPDDLVAITLHTRFATSGKGFENTHPFVNNGEVSLIHNGIIHTPDSSKMKMSTCDSEVILTDYVDMQVDKSLDGLDKFTMSITKNVNSYFACALMSNRQGNILDIMRCGTASLSAAYIKELDIVMFSTLEHHIATACKSLSLTYMPFDVAKKSLVRLNAITGDVIDMKELKLNEYKWEPEKYGYRGQRSWGYGGSNDALDKFYEEEKKINEHTIEKENALVLLATTDNKAPTTVLDRSFKLISTNLTSKSLESFVQ